MSGVADFRSAIRRALVSAEADAVPPDVTMSVLVSELGKLMADASVGSDLGQLIASVQGAIEYAASKDSALATLRSRLN